MGANVPSLLPCKPIMESRAYAVLALVFLILMTGGAAYLFYWLQAAEPEDRIF